MGKVEKHKAVTLLGAEMERFYLPERVSNRFFLVLTLLL